MKRSEINRLQKEALKFFAKNNFSLPEWATWRPDDWKKAGGAIYEIKRRRLGWDITDFGSGDFSKQGLVLFTLRNGLQDGSAELYCEKAMICRAGQMLPAHFHYSKTEDIINRAGGKLSLTLWNSDNKEKTSNSPVEVRIDGIWRKQAAGRELLLSPGQSITLVPGVYHIISAKKADVLIGEVSSVNDDEKDNRFLKSTVRFMTIEEDEPILYYLCNEYK